MFVFLSGKKKENKKEKKAIRKLYSTVSIHLNPSSQPSRQYYLLLWTADINVTWKRTRLNSRDDSTKQLSAFTSEEQNWRLIQVIWTNLPFSSLLWPQREVEALMSTNKDTSILLMERHLLNTRAPFSPSGTELNIPIFVLVSSLIQELQHSHLLLGK